MTSNGFTNDADLLGSPFGKDAKDRLAFVERFAIMMPLFCFRSTAEDSKLRKSQGALFVSPSKKVQSDEDRPSFDEEWLVVNMT